jgi:hypothetical protein
VQVDENIEICVELASLLSHLVPIINTTVKRCEEIERKYSNCPPFSTQWKSQKSLPLEQL